MVELSREALEFLPTLPALARWPAAQVEETREPRRLAEPPSSGLGLRQRIQAKDVCQPMAQHELLVSLSDFVIDSPDAHGSEGEVEVALNLDGVLDVEEGEVRGPSYPPIPPRAPM